MLAQVWAVWRKPPKNLLVPTCTHGGTLQDDAVVDEADVLGGLGGAWALAPQ